MTSSGQKALKNFKNVKFNPLELKDVLPDDSNNPAKKFCNIVAVLFPIGVSIFSKKLHVNAEIFFNDSS